MLRELKQTWLLKKAICKFGSKFWHRGLAMTFPFVPIFSAVKHDTAQRWCKEKVIICLRRAIARRLLAVLLVAVFKQKQLAIFAHRSMQTTVMLMAFCVFKYYGCTFIVCFLFYQLICLIFCIKHIRLDHFYWFSKRFLAFL